MLNENRNNGFHWKNKLERLESLPGETFNKEVAWDMLHGRLQKKSVNKKIVWLYAAAASLLIALTFTWFPPAKKENVTVKNVKHASIQKSSLINLNKDSMTAIRIKSSEKKPVSSIESHEKIMNSVDRKIFTIGNITIKNEQEKITAPEISNNTISPADIRSNIVAIVPERKKLPVVHINELGDPVEEPPIMAHKTETHSFQIKIANQEVFVIPSITSRKTGFTILSTKNSPN
ncbi:MAG: hypothetical protein M3Z92_13115 [Bacteroidota bacterium]|nr:hypothetical protein [Bacteroidota bacterium]